MVLADLVREYPTMYPNPQTIEAPLGCWDTLVGFIYNLSDQSRWLPYARNAMKTDKSELEIVEELNRGGNELFAMLGVNL